MRTRGMLRSKKLRVVGIVVAVLFLAVVGARFFRMFDDVIQGDKTTDSPNPRRLATPGAPLLDEVPEAIKLSGEYLMDQATESGQFVYRINLKPDRRVADRYNMLRHAGSIYSLLMYHEVHPSPELERIIVRAGDWMKRVSVYPVEENPEVMAVWSDGEIVLDNDPLEAKLGGAGLGLVALADMERIMPGSTGLDTLRALGRFILWMQKPDGGFYSKYKPTENGRDDSWTSLYYPGEAALGLLMLNRIDPDTAWVGGATRTLEYLSALRAPRRRVDADHWALLATRALIKENRDYLSRLQYNDVMSHAIKVCRSMIAEKEIANRHAGTPHLGSFYADGRTTPTATRLEGLLAMLDILPPEERALKYEIQAAVNDGMEFLLTAQVVDGQYAGALPRALDELPKKHPAYSKDFNRRSTEVRIDYVQHALSAMIQYQRQMGLNAGPADVLQ